MKVISKGSFRKTCNRCGSVVEMFSYEMNKIGPPGPYEVDCYEPSEVSKTYWRCPVCGTSNWVNESDDYDSI
jgi:ribosomal protein S27AE